MGHHAQYRKRGSTPAALTFQLPPPGDAEWTAEWNGSNIRVKFLVVLPAPATAMNTSYQPSAGEWETGLSGSVKDAWFAIEAGAVPGLYYVRTRWSIIVGGFIPISGWSNAKPITVT